MLPAGTSYIDQLHDYLLTTSTDSDQFKSILQAASVKLKDSDYQSGPVRAFMDCCVRHHMSLRRVCHIPLVDPDVSLLQQR